MEAKARQSLKGKNGREKRRRKEEKLIVLILDISISLQRIKNILRTFDLSRITLSSRA